MSQVNTMVKAQIRCHIGWKLLEELNNSGNNSTTMEYKIKIVTSKQIDGKNFSKAVHEATAEAADRMKLGASATATWGPVSATVSSEFESSKTLKDFVSSTTETTRETSTKTERTEEKSVHVGPGDKLFFYQQTFTGPGIYFELDATSVTSQKKDRNERQDVDIIVESKQVRFIELMDVAYGEHESDVPEGRIRAFNDISDDINHGFGGKYVWLNPIWGTEADKCATSFDIQIQNGSKAGGKDLAAGAGGAFRYVYTNKDQNQAAKVVDAKLIRSGSQLTSKQQQDMLGSGWVGGNRDINSGRKGDFLYLAQKLY